MSHPPPGTIRPSDGSRQTPVPQASREAVREAIEAGRHAQRDWARLSIDARAKTLLEAGRVILADQMAGCEVMSDETGRGPTECRMSELASTLDYVKGAIRAGRAALRPERIKLSPLDFPGKRVVVEQVPRGVIGIIAPWNYPVSNFYKSLWPALLAGNAVVMKPSEHTPRSGAWLHEKLAQALPEGLVTLVQGGGEVGQALIEEGVDSVVFTGSVPTGRRVAKLAAERLIPASLELGGKDAALVLADCDLERTALGIAQWSMHNAGQNCAGIERVYVEEAIADAFVERLGKVVSRLRVAPGDGPTELGPLQNAAQLDLVERHVKDALERGAELVTGGERTGSGYGYRPTVLDHCNHEMLVVTEETFGPVVAVVRVKDAKEAVSLANDCRYGLNGSVWTRDYARGEALARQLEVGVALVNNHAFTGILPETPWTGTKETGTGVAASRHAYHGFVRPRTVLVDRSSKPDPFWFPANDDLQAMSLALVERSQGRLSALFRLAGLLGKRVKAIQSLTRD
ncbi:MAG: aldehyde dehydrogenase family protein [Polyangiaceae bacterium]|nr:aldehyde dehydrogenase family protein [Polyangiaceae bacterium]MCW5789721.1 aldehyde dehydrogenase family protein [Polyangiaceae bacterium]